MWGNGMTDSYTCQYHHISQCFKTGSWSKLYIHLKREIPQEKAYALCHCLMSALLSTYTDTGWNDFITRSLLWSNTVDCITQSSTDHFHTDFCIDCSVEASLKSSTLHCSEYYWLAAPRRIFNIPMWKGMFSPWLKNNSVWTWLPKLLL
jgi:hypothetical protein